MSTQDDLKRFATLRAIAALSGVTLFRMEGDLQSVVYIATRWAMTKQLDSLDEAATWLSRVAGKAVEVSA